MVYSSSSIICKCFHYLFCCLNFTGKFFCNFFLLVIVKFLKYFPTSDDPPHIMLNKRDFLGIPLIDNIFYLLLLIYPSCFDTMRMLKALIFVSFEIVLLQVSFWHMSNPWVMGWACWCACAHQALSVGIVTFFALASSAVRRGWGVAFPGFKVFDLVQRCWILDPLKTLGNCHDPHVTRGGPFP